MKTVKELREAIQEQHDRVAAILSVAKTEQRDLNAEEEKEIDEIQGKGDQAGKLGELEAKLDRLLKVEAAQKQIARQRFESDEKDRPGFSGEASISSIKVPAKARGGSVRSFVGPDAEREAYVAGQFFLAINGSKPAGQWLENHGIQAAMRVGDNTAGGFLVPDVMETAIIRNVEQFGVARREVRQYPMGPGVTLLPRRASGFNSFFAAENTAVTASDLAFDSIRLEARKLMVFSS